MRHCVQVQGGGGAWRGVALAGEGSLARGTRGHRELGSQVQAHLEHACRPARPCRMSDARHFTWKSVFGPLFLVLPRKKILIVNTLMCVCVCVCVALNDDVPILMGYTSPWKNKRKRAFDTHWLPPDVLHAFSM